MSRRKSPLDVLHITANRLAKQATPGSVLLRRALLLPPFDPEDIDPEGFLRTTWQGTVGEVATRTQAVLSIERVLGFTRRSNLFARIELSEMPLSPTDTEVTLRFERLIHIGRSLASYATVPTTRKESGDPGKSAMPGSTDWANGLIDGVEARQLLVLPALVQLPASIPGQLAAGKGEEQVAPTEGLEE